MARAVAWPIPLSAPVISATFPSKQRCARDIHWHIEVATDSVGELRDVHFLAGPHARPADGRRHIGC
jgi:hypothetical protein